jgi:diguanylate cyclase (GGDEF)-like protein
MTTDGTTENDPLQAQYDGIPVPCYTWRRDGEELVLERANRAAFEQAGDRLGSLIGSRVLELYPDRPDIEADLELVLDEHHTVRREMEHTLLTGEVRRLDVSYVFVPPDRVMVHADDITELRESEERLTAVIATLESGLLTVDLKGRITDANPAACALLGMSQERLLSEPRWWEAISLRYDDGRPLTPGDPGTPGRRALHDGEAVRDVTLLVTRPEGDVVAVSANYQPLRRGHDGPIQGLVISIIDLTEAHRMRDRLVRQALHDPLTGLPNRLLFQERLEQALARPLRRRVAVLLLGLDRFRAVNESHGHTAGDEVLMQVAARLQAELDLSQPLVRFGGDEFAVLAELDDEREAAALAERLNTSLEEPIGDIFVTAAIGIAVEDRTNGGTTDLVTGADAAMQRVKARGGGTYEVFDRAMGGRLRDRLKIEDGLRRALERDELRLHYQPIVDLDTGERYAVEALLRWHHPSRGLLAAGDFIDVAEDSSLIVDLGRWVVAHACRQLADWDATLGDDAPQLMFINLSAAELTHPGVGRLVTSSAASAGIDPSRLVLEITETGLLAEPGRAAAVSRTLRDLGCEVAIDDFGTGYSSLSRLIELPARILKIDQSFVRGLVDNPDSMAVVSAILLLAHNLRKLVVAEGVEDAESLEVLREMGCRYAQGFHLARPSEAL